MIDRNNYEIWFIDFFDGTLNDDEKKLLYVFLEENADIKIEFNNFDKSLLTPDKLVLSEEYKTELKKKSTTSVGKINKNNAEEFLIREIENDLNEEEKNNLKIFIKQNQIWENERNIFQLTKQIANEKIIFSGKRKLKKGIIVKSRILFWYWSSAAAIFIMGLFFLVKYFNSPVEEVKQVAVKNEKNKIIATDSQKTVEEKILKDIYSNSQKNNFSVKDKPQPGKIKEDKILLKENFVAIVELPHPSIVPNDFHLEKIAIVLPERKIKNILPSENNIAKNTEKNLPDFIAEKVNAYIGDSIIDSKKAKINWWNIVQLASNFISKTTDKNISLNKNENTYSNSYSFAVGGFEISRTVTH